MPKQNVFKAQRKNKKPVEMLPGVFRTTLCYDEQTMLCHIRLAKGAVIPSHQHPATQNGYVISGKIRLFETADDVGSIAEAGDGYLFPSGTYHGVEVVEDTELIECFAPMREEYAD